MPAALAFITATVEVGLTVAAIAAWLVLMCLKAVAGELEHAVRCHNLKIEVHTLRLQQLNRMRDMGVGKKKR